MGLGLGRAVCALSHIPGGMPTGGTACTRIHTRHEQTRRTLHVYACTSVQTHGCTHAMPHASVCTRCTRYTDVSPARSHTHSHTAPCTPASLHTSQVRHLHDCAPQSRRALCPRQPHAPRAAGTRAHPLPRTRETPAQRLQTDRGMHTVCAMRACLRTQAQRTPPSILQGPLRAGTQGSSLNLQWWWVMLGCPVAGHPVAQPLCLPCPCSGS